MHKHEFPLRVGIFEVVFKPFQLSRAKTVGGRVVGIENGEVRVCVIERVVVVLDLLDVCSVLYGVVEESVDRACLVP